MQTDHLFGNNGRQIQSTFSIKVSFAVLNNRGEINFTIRADVLEGDHLFIIGIPTLRRIQATTDIPNNRLEFKIEGRPYKKIILSGNRIYLSHAKLALAERHFFNNESY